MPKRNVDLSVLKSRKQMKIQNKDHVFYNFLQHVIDFSFSKCIYILFNIYHIIYILYNIRIYMYIYIYIYIYLYIYIYIYR